MKALRFIAFLIALLPAAVLGQASNEIIIDFGYFENDNFIVELTLKKSNKDTLEKSDTHNDPYRLISVVSPKIINEKKSVVKTEIYYHPKIIDYSISNDSIRVSIMYNNLNSDTLTQNLSFTINTQTISSSASNFQLTCIHEYNYECYRETFHENGNLKTKYQISNDGKANGFFETYYKNGKLATRSVYKNNILFDDLTYYYNNGKKEFIIKVKKGVIEKRILYDSTGSKRNGIHVAKRPNYTFITSAIKGIPHGEYLLIANDSIFKKGMYDMGERVYDSTLMIKQPYHNDYVLKSQ